MPLNKTKQDALDAWAKLSYTEKCAPKGFEADGVTPKPTASETMMQLLQGELTESVLDAAIAKAQIANPKPGEGGE